MVGPSGTLRGKPRPAARRALEGERAAEALDAIGEPAQAAALLVGSARAVVGDADVDLPGVGRDAVPRRGAAPACFWTLASASATT